MFQTNIEVERTAQLILDTMPLLISVETLEQVPTRREIREWLRENDNKVTPTDMWCAGINGTRQL